MLNQVSYKDPLQVLFHFNIFINDTFYEIEASEICNFHVDNTIHALSHSVDSMIAK